MIFLFLCALSGLDGIPASRQIIAAGEEDYHILIFLKKQTNALLDYFLYVIEGCFPMEPVFWV